MYRGMIILMAAISLASFCAPMVATASDGLRVLSKQVAAATDELNDTNSTDLGPDFDNKDDDSMMSGDDNNDNLTDDNGLNTDSSDNSMDVTQ